MTNAQIIFNESVELMNAGIIAGTGRFLKTSDGNEIEVPEPIHTYKKWQDLGFQVRKGEKAVAQFNIWKRTAKESEDDNGNISEEDIKLFMKKASFFALSQVDVIEAAN